MTTGGGSNRACGDLETYEIRLRGHIDTRWAGSLEGVLITLEGDGITTLTGTLADQSALHGMLNRIRDLGLQIISIQRVCPDDRLDTNENSVGIHHRSQSND